MKVRKKILSIILAVCILVGIGVVSSNIDKKAEASSSGPYIDSYMTQYFYDLRNNFSLNKKTCSYVSMGMFLSYYDNCVNANIIPEQYENTVSSNVSDFTANHNSPGVRREIGISDPNKTPDNIAVDLSTYVAFYEDMFSQENLNVSFQAKLFSISQDLGYMPTNADACDEHSGGLQTISAGHVIENYLIERGFILDLDDPVSLSDGEFVVYTFQKLWLGHEERSRLTKNFIKSQILLGRPVIATIDRKNYPGEKDAAHSVVAYDYDEATDEIYFHTGWGCENDPNYHRKLSDINYTHWREAISLEINTPHVCDNNYVYNGVGYCYHDEEINTYNHTHVFSEYIDYTVVDGTTYHTVQCNGCIEKRTNVTTHHFSNCAYYSTTLHKSTCICGYMQTSAHYVNRLEIQEDAMGRRYAPCMGCGVRVYLNNTIVGGQPWSLGIKYSLNGSQKLPNGLIILEIEDVESYLLGTLQFYNENELNISIV